MAGIVEVAKAAGLNPVKCPHCGRNIRTGAGVFVRLFRAILEHVRSGEEVRVIGFGFFRRVVMPRHVVPDGAKWFAGNKALDASGQEVGPAIRIVFKQSRVAKAFLNKEDKK